MIVQGIWLAEFAELAKLGPYGTKSLEILYHDAKR